MASLVATEDIYLEDVEEWAIVTIISEPTETEIVHKRRVLEPPPEPMQKPDGVARMSRPESQPISAIQKNVNLPNVELSSNLDSQEFLLAGFDDTDAVPIYRSLPRFPIEAVDEKVSGWVMVQFSINRKGRAVDVVVIDAEPKDIFDQAAMDALKNWKYKPKVYKGKTVKQTGLAVRIDFGKK